MENPSTAMVLLRAENLSCSGPWQWLAQLDALCSESTKGYGWDYGDLTGWSETKVSTTAGQAMNGCDAPENQARAEFRASMSFLCRRVPDRSHKLHTLRLFPVSCAHGIVRMIGVILRLSSSVCCLDGPGSRAARRAFLIVHPHTHMIFVQHAPCIHELFVQTRTKDQIHPESSMEQ